MKLYVPDKWDFPKRVLENILLDRKEHLGAIESSGCCNLPSAQTASVEPHSMETADQHRNNEEVFVFSSKPRSAPYGKSPTTSPESYVASLDLEPENNGEREETETEDNCEGIDSSEEVGHFVHITLDKKQSSSENS